MRPRPTFTGGTPTFRSVVTHIGLSTAWRYAASQDIGGWFDTVAFAAAAMKTHDLDWSECDDAPVLHYAQAAERRDPAELMRLKDEDCLRRLDRFRVKDTTTR